MYAPLNTVPGTGFRPGVGMGCLECDGEYDSPHTLGALDPAAVADSIMPESAISNTPGFTQSVWNDIEASAKAGDIEGFVQTCPAQAGPSGAQLVSVGAGSGASIALAIPAIASGPFAPFVLAGAALVGLFAQLFQHHAQAVAKEQQVECAAVPAFNDAIQAISQGVTSATITPQQGISALSQLLSEFHSQISSIMREDSQNCNAGCVWWKCAQAAVALMQSEFQDMINQAATVSATGDGSSIVAGGTVTTTAPSTSWFSQNSIFSALPNWGVLGIAAAAAWLFMGGKS